MAARPKDKWFHLIVSLCALAIAAVALASLAYSHRDALRNWWNIVSHRPTLVTTATPGQVLQHTQPANRLLPANDDIKAEPAYRPTTLDSLVIVKPYRTDVTTKQIADARMLLAKYDIVQTVSKSLQMNLYQPVYVYLAENSSDYQHKLAELGFSRQDAKQLTADTGGYTQGSTIVIPLYQNTADYDLANTLAHELTHAFLNINVGEVPSWINEGIAVHDGMMVQRQVDNSVAYEGFAKRMAESILDAVRSNKLVPLTDDENKVLAGDTPYDLELQDWLAVNDLLAQSGPNALRDFFFRLKLAEPVSKAFSRSFHQSFTTYNTSFTNLLRSAANTQDNGVQITMDIPASYAGNIRVLQHGSQSWQGFKAEVGTSTFTLTKAGALKGDVSQTSAAHDTTPPDNGTLYIDLDPDATLLYNGQSVDDCGFAIDVHDGLYGYVNTWITFSNGKSIYSRRPTLFGVTISSVTELQSTNAVDVLIS